MNPDPIIDRALFTDGIVRLVYRDDAGHQYVIDHHGHAPLRGVALPGRRRGGRAAGSAGAAGPGRIRTPNRPEAPGRQPSGEGSE
jgi:hypothetical protein